MGLKTFFVTLGTVRNCFIVTKHICCCCSSSYPKGFFRSMFCGCCGGITITRVKWRRNYYHRIWIRWHSMCCTKIKYTYIWYMISSYLAVTLLKKQTHTHTYLTIQKRVKGVWVISFLSTIFLSPYILRFFPSHRIIPNTFLNFSTLDLFFSLFIISFSLNQDVDYKNSFAGFHVVCIKRRFFFESNENTC